MLVNTYKKQKNVDENVYVSIVIELVFQVNLHIFNTEYFFWDQNAKI